MKAIKRFAAHYEGDTRWFDPGDDVPDEWVSSIAGSLLDGGGEAFPEFGALNTAVEVVGWVMSEDDDEVARAKAQYALDVELAGKNRTTVVEPLQELLGIG